MSLFPWVIGASFESILERQEKRIEALEKSVEKLQALLKGEIKDAKQYDYSQTQ